MSDRLIPILPHCRENKVVGRTSVRRGAECKRLRRTEVRPTKTAYSRTSAILPNQPVIAANGIYQA